MSRPLKLIVGMAAVAPILLMIGSSMINSAASVPYVPGTEVDPSAMITTYLMTATAFVIYVLTFIGFALHLRSNPRALAGGGGMLWIWALLLCGGITFPIYWYKYIWKSL